MLSKFDEKNPFEHMMKIMFGCGVYAAFRGSKEHTFFYRSQVKIGVYPRNFENRDLAGLRYAAIDHFVSDKACQVTVNNSYSRDCSTLLRFPIVAGDMDNFGGSIERLIKKMHPAQERMYCKPASPGKRMEFMHNGYPDAQFYEDIPLGDRTIRNLMKRGAEILGISNFDKFKPHSLRGACISSLVNNGVSLADTMHVARHNSASASRVYQRVDGISEGVRLSALGQFPSNCAEKEDGSSCSAEASKKKGGNESDDSRESTGVILKKSGRGKKKAIAASKNDGSESDSDESNEFLRKTRAGRKKKAIAASKNNGNGSDSSESNEFLRCSVGRKKKAPIEIDDSSSDESAETKHGNVEGSTQEDIASLKESIIDLQDVMQHGIPTKPSKRRNNSKVNLTQVHVGELEDQIMELKKKLEAQTKQLQPMSENRKEVIRLKGIVKSLTDRLEFNELYTGSLEHDVDVRILELEDELKAERALRKKTQRENAEFQEYIYRDQKRGRRKY